MDTCWMNTSGEIMSLRTIPEQFALFLNNLKIIWSVLNSFENNGFHLSNVLQFQIYCWTEVHTLAKRQNMQEGTKERVHERWELCWMNAESHPQSQVKSLQLKTLSGSTRESWSSHEAYIKRKGGINRIPSSSKF